MAENTLIFPISGHSCRTLRRPPHLPPHFSILDLRDLVPEVVDPECDRPIFCVRLLDILSGFVAFWRCRVGRFLLEVSQKGGCFCLFRLQFFRHRTLSSGDLFRTRDLQDLPPKLCEKRWIKSRISCEFFRSFLLRFANISQKDATFNIEFDFQMSSFSSNPDKNNRTRKIDLFHTLGSAAAADALADVG